MFDQTGKLLLSDAELEAEARAVACLTIPSYGNDALWVEHWQWFLSGQNDPNSCVHYSSQSLAVRQARAAIEAWKRNASYGLDAVPWSHVLEMLE